MYEVPYTGGGDIPDPLLSTVKEALGEFKEAVRAHATAKGLPLGAVAALHPCNLLVVLDQSHLHIAFTDKNAGGLPRKHHADRRNFVFTPTQVLQAAVNEVHFEMPEVVTFNSNILHDQQARASEIAEVAARYVSVVYREFRKMKAPTGFESLQVSLDRFFKDHPDYEKNVFVMMRFRPAEHFKKIHSTIVHELAKYGLKAHRADDRVYPEDDDLWNNICVYIAGCKYGIAVFEDFDEREFNPNVPLEYGMMRAWGKRVLLLKEQRMPKLPSDVTGKLYKSFDMMQIEESIKSQIEVWIKRDLKL
jgi:hypothetical protein